MFVRTSAFSLLAIVGCFAATAQTSLEDLQFFQSAEPFSQEKFGHDVALHGDWLAVASDASNSPLGISRVSVFSLTTGELVFSQLSIEEAQPVALDEGLLLYGNQLWNPVTQAFLNSFPVFGVGDNALDQGRGILGASDYQRAVLIDAQTNRLIHELQTPSFQPADGFGESVDLWADFALVGAPNRNGAAANQGAAFLYSVSSGELLHVLSASDGSSNDRFGAEVAIGSNVAVVGAPNDSGDNGQSPLAGSAYVFDLQSGQELFKLLASDGMEFDRFGSALDVASNRIVVGAFGASPAPEKLLGGNNGAAYTFDALSGLPLERISAPLTTQTQTLLPPSEWFGWSVAMDCNRIAIGAPLEDDPSGAWVNSGAAYLLSNSTSTYCNGKISSEGCLPRVSSVGMASLSNPTEFLIQAERVPAAVNGLFFFGVSGPASDPFQGGTLCVAPPIQRTELDVSTDVLQVNCSGTLAISFADLLVAGDGNAELSLGDTVYGQFWFRDSFAADGTGAGLSDAIRFNICP